VVSRSAYLVDTSVLHRTHHDAVRQRLAGIGTTRLHICTIVALEVGYSARHAAEHERVLSLQRASYAWAHMNADAEDRALELQGILATRNHHRAARLPDLLIAATAEIHGLTVLHYDHDFDLIADASGQRCDWVVPRGSVD
jgi:predicted nucleic acid-binding protein